MKNIVKISLTFLACSILVACSSGSSNNPESQAKPSQAKPSQAKPSQAKPSQAKPSQVDSNLSSSKPQESSTGGVYIISGSGGKVTTNLKVLNDASNLNFIIVDNQKIRVGYQDLGLQSGTWTKINNSMICCGTFSGLRFGVIGSTNEKENDYFFYNGNPTKVMPTSGTATYNGGFAITGKTKQFEDEDYLQGSAKFQADFGAKTLIGTLTEPTLQPIDIKAKVSGNSFSGTASSKDFATQAEVEGKFYGTNAKELGGLFKSNKSWGGAFGASQ